MIEWLSANWGTLVVAVAVVALLVFLVVKQIKNAKEGKTNCGCGCEHCAMKDSCHPKEK